MKNQKLFATFGIAVILSITSGIILMDHASNDTLFVTGTQQKSISGEAQYVTTDPFEIRQNAGNMIKGEIKSIEKGFDYRDEAGNQLSEDGPKVTLKTPVTFYNVDVERTLKGTIDDSQTVTIRTILGSNVDYQIGDKVIVMLGKYDEQDYFHPWAGPHGMFKIKNGIAVGTE
ncbi:MAG: hypothetical protein OEY10_06760, partial [Nitrosopumilus sp.]|nr:hypothetical protein [Nitrosopumilus sp.]